MKQKMKQWLAMVLCVTSINIFPGNTLQLSANAQSMLESDMTVADASDNSSDALDVNSVYPEELNSIPTINPEEQVPEFKDSTDNDTEQQVATEEPDVEPEKNMSTNNTAPNDGEPDDEKPIDPRFLLHFDFEGRIFPTGNYSRTDTDLTLVNAAFDYSITRSYNSQSNHAGKFGYGWSSPLDITLSKGTPNDKTVKLPNGLSYTFSKDSSTSQQYVCAETRDILTYCNENGEEYFLYQIVGEQIQYKFNTTDTRPIEIVHESGHKITLTYRGARLDRLTDDRGNIYQISYYYDYIREIICDTTDTLITYTYDYPYYLTSVNANGSILHYEYDDWGRICAVKNADNVLLESMEYYTYLDQSYVDNNLDELLPEGSLKTHIDESGAIRQYSYQYNEETEEFTVTASPWDYPEYSVTMDKEGNITSLSYNDVNAQTLYEYNTLHEIIRKTDTLNGVTVYERDDKGRITQIRYADGSYICYAYNEKNKITSTLNSDGKAVLYLYDTDMLSLLHRAEYLLPTNTLPVYDASSADLFAVKTYEYYRTSDARNGLCAAYTDPVGNQTTYIRDEATGNLLLKIDANGEETAYTYNSRNLMISKTTPLGYRAVYDYDNANHLIRMTDETTGAVTRYVYDSCGRLIQEITPDQYQSEQDGLNKASPDFGYADFSVGTRYVYHGPTSYTKISADNYVTQYSACYFSNHVMFIESAPALAADWDIGNPFSDTSPRQIRDYDTRNKLYRTCFGDYEYPDRIYYYAPNSDYKGYSFASYVVTQSRYHYQYSEGAFINTSIDETKYYYNCHDQLIAIEYPDGSSEYFCYDLDNRLLAYTDCNGNVYNYSYSINTVTKTYCNDAGNDITQTENYDKNGRLLSVSVCEQTPVIIQQYVYDAVGNVICSMSGLSKTVYAYDSENRCIRKEEYTSENDKIVTEYIYSFDSATHTQTATETRGISSGTLYNDDSTLSVTTIHVLDASGNEIKTTDPNGNITLKTYNHAGQVTSESVVEQDGSVTLIAQTSYDGDGNITSVTDGNGNTTYFTYDAFGSMATMTDARGGTSVFIHDFSGNLLIEQSAGNHDTEAAIETGNYIRYEYDSRDRRVKVFYHTVDDTTGAVTETLYRRYEYDDNGNITAEYNSDDQKIAEYTYTSINQLKEIIEEPLPESECFVTHAYTYDMFGRMTSEKHYPNDAVTYTYDLNGNLLTQSIGGETVAEYTYDRMGRRMSAHDASVNAVYTYNELGLIKSIVHAGDSTIPQNTVTRQYDKAGNLIFESDSSQTSQLYTYDNQNRVTALTVSGGNETFSYAWSYDGAGHIASETDACGYVTSYTYDADGHMLTQTKDGKTVTKTYDADGNLLTSTDWNGVESSYTYDWLGRVTEKRNADGVYYESYTYDANGNLETVYDGFGTTTYRYNASFGNELQQVTDALGRIKRRVFRNPSLERVMYIVDDYIPYACSTDSRGNVISIGHYIGTYSDNTYTALDDDGNLVMPMGAENAIEKFTYDKYGNLTSRIDARGNTTEYQYNCQNKLVKVIYPCEDGETPTEETYSYDADGRIVTKIDRAGQCINYMYDLLGRCISEVVWSPAGLISNSKWYTYDANGNILNSGGRTRTYDAFNRVLTDTQPGIGTFTYAYDIPLVNGAYKETMQHDDIGLIEKIYNADGQLAEVKLDNESCMCYTYNIGKLSFFTSDITGIWNILYYNAAGQVSTYLTDLAEYTYTYDNLANIVSSVEYIYQYHFDEQADLYYTEKTYTYDNAGRLLTETDSTANRKIQYDYDSVGNLTRRAIYALDTNAELDIRTYAYDSNNRIGGAEFSPYSYQNDANGNLTQENESDCVTYTYDGYNRLVSVNNPELPFLEYEYDQDNLRTAKIESDMFPASAKTVYGYDKDGSLVLEKNAYRATDKTVYLWADDGMAIAMKRDGKAYLYCYDGVGKIRAVLADWESDDVQFDGYDYTAYGEPLYADNSIKNPIRYAGYYYDTDTGLYYLKNRYYAANKARFLTEDPYWNVGNMLYGKFTGAVQKMVYYPAVVQSGNRFAYCENNPITFTDPNGLIGILPDGTIYMDDGDTLVDKELLEYKIGYENATDDMQRSLYAEKAQDLRKWHPGQYKVKAEHSLDMYYIPDVTETLNDFLDEHESEFDKHPLNLIWFINNVKTGALVDVKSYHEDFMRPPESYHIIYEGEVLRADAPGNIAYGYLGMAACFGEKTLLYGAGVYQMYEDAFKHNMSVSLFRIFKNYGDNEGDPEQIKIGIRRYKEKYPEIFDIDFHRQ